MSEEAILMSKAVAVGISVLASLFTINIAAASASETGYSEASSSAQAPGDQSPSCSQASGDQASSYPQAAGCSEPSQTGVGARKTIDLDYGWRFRRGEIPGDEASETTYDDSSWEIVNLPHNPQVDKARQTCPNYTYEGVAWYRRRFSLDSSYEGKKVFLEFEAAGIRTDLWVNGVLLTTHYGQYLPFTVDITGSIRFDGTENVVVVKADNTDDPHTPIGNANWFNWGGIHRDVKIHITDRVHITDPIYENKPAGGGVFVTYSDVSPSHATVNVKTHIRNENQSSADCTLKTSIVDAGGMVVAEAEDSQSISGCSDHTFEQSIIVQDPNLWHPDHPYLYILRSEVYVDRVLVDRYDTRIGIRTIKFSRENGFEINGERLMFRGANRMSDYPYVGYAMPNSGQIRDAVKLKEAGFQVVRTSHYPQDPAFLDACDELGLMVIAPIPGFQYVGGEAFKKRSYQDMRDLIRRDRNRPSVILWELSLNETDFDRGYALNAVRIGHEEYPTDQCYIAGWKYDTIYDVYLRNADHKPGPADYRGPAPLVIDEYGHWGYGGANSTSDVSRRDGERSMLVQAGNHQESLNRNRKIPFLCGDAVWAGIDLAAYDSGVLDNFRLPKFSYYLYQSQRDPGLVITGIDSGPMVYIASYWTEQSSREVTVYSNCDEVELCLNGRLVERRRPDTGPNADSLLHPPFTFNVADWEPGELKAVGLISGREAASHVVRTPMEPELLTLLIDTTGCGLSRTIGCSAPNTAGCGPSVTGKNGLFVFASICDSSGTVVRTDNTTEVDFEISGPGKLISPRTIKAEAGIAAAMIETCPDPGYIIVTAFDRRRGLTASAILAVNDPKVSD